MTNVPQHIHTTDKRVCQQAALVAPDSTFAAEALEKALANSNVDSRVVGVYKAEDQGAEALPGLSHFRLETDGLSGGCKGAEPLAGGRSPQASVLGTGVTQTKQHLITTHTTPRVDCPNAGWLRGVCAHGTTRWVKMSCKKRDCPVCGEIRQKKVAWRVGVGLDELGGKAGGGWFVGTFARDISKKEAVKVQGKFVQWLRRDRGRKNLQYVATWELQKSGRLHLNLIMAPWSYVPKKTLGAKWEAFGGGRVVWIERVYGSIGAEVAKTNELGGYMCKWEQMVMSGKGVTYSKKWPKLPEQGIEQRKGQITWFWVGVLSTDSSIFWYERELDYWREMAPGEWVFSAGEDCDCFERGPPDDSCNAEGCASAFGAHFTSLI